MSVTNPMSDLSRAALKYLSDGGEHKATYIGLYAMKATMYGPPKHTVARRVAANVLKGLVTRGYVQRVGTTKRPLFTITPKGMDIVNRDANRDV